MKICPQCRGNNLDGWDKCSRCGTLLPAHVPTVLDGMVFDPTATPDPMSITQYNQAPVVRPAQSPTGVVIAAMGTIILVLVGVLIGQSHQQAPVTRSPAPVTGNPTTATVATPTPTYNPPAAAYTPPPIRPMPTYTAYTPPPPVYNTQPIRRMAAYDPAAAAAAAATGRPTVGFSTQAAPQAATANPEPDVKAMTEKLLAAANPVIETTRTGELPRMLSHDNFRRADVAEVKTNIEKTNSLTSPYLGDVSVAFTCTYGPNQLSDQVNTSTEYRTFTFGWQGGQWVLTHTDFNPPH